MLLAESDNIGVFCLFVLTLLKTTFWVGWVYRLRATYWWLGWEALIKV